MLRYNAAMSSALSALHSLGEFPAELSLVAQSGFYQKDGCKFLKYFEEMKTNVDLSHFADRTGYECFINSIHIDDFVDSNWLGGALRFARQLLDCWLVASHSEVLQVIVACNEMGVTVKAHVIRAGESWLSDDLEEYEDAVLLATSEGQELNELLSEVSENRS